MGITAQFRPTQHQYQSTHDPYPFKEMIPMAMKMRQESMAGMDKAMVANTMIAGSVIATADQEEGARKIEELTERVSGIAGKNKSFRSPEFHMNLNKVISDFKGDQWFKQSAHNAKMEQEWNKILVDPNVNAADKFELEDEYKKYKTLGTKDYGLLASPTAPKRDDYFKVLDAQGKGYADESWMRNGTMTIGTRQDEIAYGYGLYRGKDGNFKVGNISQGFLGSDAGKSLIRDAKYLAKTTDIDYREALDKLYLNETEKLVYKHAGSVDRKDTATEAYEGLNFQSYMGEHAANVQTRQAEEAFNSIKNSNSLIIWDKIKELPGYATINNMATKFLANLKSEGKTDEDIRGEIAEFQQKIYKTIASVSKGKAIIGAGAALAISKALTVPLEYGLTVQTPDVEDLSQDHKNILYRVLENKELRTSYEKHGLTDELWEEMEKTTMKFYEEGTWANIGLNITDDSKAEKHVAQTTARLFGIGADKGKITIGKGGNMPGMISQHIIIDVDTGEKVKINDLDLPAGEEVIVEYKGTLDPRNQYGPQTLAVHIDGKEYYVLGQNPSRTAVRANNLHSYEFNFSGIGGEFNTGLRENGEAVTAIPSYNYETKQYELEMNDGTIYGSSSSIENAYEQYLLTIDKNK